MRDMRQDVFSIAFNAVGNASNTAVARQDIIDMLATGDGDGGQVRALFGDCSFETLERLGLAAGISSSSIKSAYRYARTHHAAANADLEAMGDDKERKAG